MEERGHTFVVQDLSNINEKKRKREDCFNLEEPPQKKRKLNQEVYRASGSTCVVVEPKDKTPPSPPSKKKQKRKINIRACEYCRKLHKKCDGVYPNVPCSRCLAKGIKCVYKERKRRGPKSKKGKEVGEQMTIHPSLKNIKLPFPSSLDDKIGIVGSNSLSSLNNLSLPPQSQLNHHHHQQQIHIQPQPQPQPQQHPPHHQQHQHQQQHQQQQQQHHHHHSVVPLVWDDFLPPPVELPNPRILQQSNDMSKPPNNHAQVIGPLQFFSGSLFLATLHHHHHHHEVSSHDNDGIDDQEDVEEVDMNQNTMDEMNGDGWGI